METNHALCLGLILLLLAVDCSLLDWKVNASAKTGVDPQSTNIGSTTEQIGESGSVSDSTGTHKKKNKVNKLKENVVDDMTRNSDSNNNNDDSSSKSGSIRTDNMDKVSNDLNEKVQAEDVDNKTSKLNDKSQAEDVDNKKNKLNEKSRVQDVDNKKSNLNEKSEVQDVDNKKTNLNEKSQVENNVKKQKTVPKESSSGGDSEVASKIPHVEECDPSNKCMDEENKLVACLRVPGNDPQYSLLIQNKGKKPLKVAISAPDFVELEKTELQLQAKEDKKVKVSITDRGGGNLIVLRAGNGHCNLDIKHVMANVGKELDSSHKSAYLNFKSQTPIIVVLACAALLILAAGWTCISIRRKQLSSSGSKYQRLDMDLPVSGVGKAESELNDGWDNNWGDDWDDEEAPKTPTLPVTPSLSSKGLASRRLSKEGWKD
ncbi:hypothetical protein JCGZ_20462 [Jatropha curcas]|uniref:DUF7356 domain-containing protein n=1 Tax=Jatropha curcas TaxID=180498 RepID=A0A067JMV4_JATCU|nr:putative histone-lysine N-methyltransferase 1 [Jatropha curcas]KDP25306.1 hypothetical protein JCGZ_20462 [Jatropha curcas]